MSVHDDNGDPDGPGEVEAPAGSDGDRARAVARAEVSDLEERLAGLKKKESRDLFWAVMGASPAALVLAVPLLLGDAVLLITMALVVACGLQWMRAFRSIQDVRRARGDLDRAVAELRRLGPGTDPFTSEPDLDDL